MGYCGLCLPCLIFLRAVNYRCRRRLATKVPTKLLNWAMKTLIFIFCHSSTMLTFDSVKPHSYHRNLIFLFQDAVGRPVTKNQNTNIYRVYQDMNKQVSMYACNRCIPNEIQTGNGKEGSLIGAVAQWWKNMKIYHHIRDMKNRTHPDNCFWVTNLPLSFKEFKHYYLADLPSL